MTSTFTYCDGPSHNLVAVPQEDRLLNQTNSRIENHPLVWTEETRYYPMPIHVKGNKDHSPITQITRASCGPKN